MEGSRLVELEVNVERTVESLCVPLFQVFLLGSAKEAEDTEGVEGYEAADDEGSKDFDVVSRLVGFVEVGLEQYCLESY